MNITKDLSDEHQNILKAAEILERECFVLETEGKFRSDFFQRAIVFIRSYADKFHHSKEEDLLFVELCKDTTRMHCNPTEQMLYEHKLGRECVAEMESGLADKEYKKILSGARGYVQLIREHIYKEDNILYPMAEEALSEKQKKELLRAFTERDTKNENLNKEGLKILDGLKWSGKI